jgi:hypothetical protein
MSDPVVVQRVGRSGWGARYSAGTRAMPKPVREVNIHHTVTGVSGPQGTDGDYDATDDPCKDMRQVEAALQGRGLAPGYSFCIHPSGVILVGAGGNVGAHTAGRNSSSYGFALIGNYDRQQPTFAQLSSMGWLINLLRYTGALVPDLNAITVQGHRATKQTACPGANMAPLVGHIKAFARAQGG